MLKKRFLVLMVVIMLSISSITPSFAITESKESELVSVEEFSRAISELYNKYETKFKILSTDNYVPITRDILKSELNELEQNLIESRNTYNKNNRKIFEIESSGALEIKAESKFKVIGKDKNFSDGEYTPFAMYAWRSFSGSRKFTHKSKLAHVTIKYSALARQDLENGQFITINPNSWTQSSLNLDKIVYNEKRWLKAAGGTQLWASANGVIRFKWTLAGSVIQAEQPFNIIDSFY